MDNVWYDEIDICFRIVLYFNETLKYSSPYMPSYVLCFLENAVNQTFYYITTLTYC